jgi:hypothetical protein
VQWARILEQDGVLQEQKEEVGQTLRWQWRNREFVGEALQTQNAVMQ